MDTPPRCGTCSTGCSASCTTACAPSRTTTRSRPARTQGLRRHHRSSTPRASPLDKLATSEVSSDRCPVGDGGDEVSVARFIADQRPFSRVPHTLTCALLGVSISWFYKWIDRTPTPSERRRSELDAAVADAFTKARGLHGSPRLHTDLR